MMSQDISQLISLLTPPAGYANVAKAIGKPYPWTLGGVDRFASTNNWSFYNANNGSADTAWTVSGNKLTPPASPGHDVSALYNPYYFADGRVQTLIENMSTSINWAGVFARAKATNQVLATLLFGSGKVELWEFGATFRPLVSVNLTTTDVQPTSSPVPYMVEMELLGNTVNVYINGRKVISSTADVNVQTYTYGQTGVIAAGGSQPQFSNFSVRSRKFNIIPPTIQKVLCIGTSITQNTSWVSRFGDKLSANYTTNTVTMINQGHAGYTTSQLLPLLQDYMTSYTPDVVVIEGGTNDLKDNIFTNYDDTISNLRQMIKIAKGQGAIPMVTTITPLSTTLNIPPEWSNTTWQRVAPLNARIRQMAAEEDVMLIDNFDSFSNDTTLLGDGIHPNDDGSERMASTALNTVLGAFSLY